MEKKIKIKNLILLKYLVQYKILDIWKLLSLNKGNFLFTCIINITEVLKISIQSKRYYYHILDSMAYSIYPMIQIMNTDCILISSLYFLCFILPWYIGNASISNRKMSVSGSL